MLRPQRFAIYACYATFVMMGVAGTLFGPAYQSLAARFNLGLDNAGIFTTLQFAGSCLGVVVIGRLLDRFPTRAMLCIGATALGTGLFLISQASTLSAVLVSGALMGFGSGTLNVSATVTITMLNPNKATAALNWLNVFFGLGAVIGPQVINVALQAGDYALAFRYSALFAFLLLVLLAATTGQIRYVGRSSQDARQPIQWSALAPITLLLFLYVGAEIGYSSWIFTQMTKVGGAPETVAAWAASLFWVGLTAGRVVATFALARLRDSQVLIGSILILGLAVLVLLALPGLQSVSLICTFAAGFGCGPIFPTALAFAANLFPEARGTVTGTLIALGNLGALGLPWLQGQIGGGRDGGMIQVVVVALIMLWLGFLVQRRERYALVADA